MEVLITILAIISGILLAIAGVMHHSYIAVFYSLICFAFGCVRALINKS
jgi:hypothetical protein